MYTGFQYCIHYTHWSTRARPSHSALPLHAAACHCTPPPQFELEMRAHFCAVLCGSMSPCLASALLALAAIACLFIGTASGADSGRGCSIVVPTSSVLCAGSRVKVHWSLPSPVRTATYLSTTGDPTRYPLQLGANHGQRLLPVGPSSRQQVSIINDAGSVLCETFVTVRPCEPCLPNSDEVLDACGVCGGKSECIGCDGIAFSRKLFDRCGFCGGSGACPKFISNGGLTTGSNTHASSVASRALHQVPDAASLFLCPTTPPLLTPLLLHQLVHHPPRSFFQSSYHS